MESYTTTSISSNSFLPNIILGIVVRLLNVMYGFKKAGKFLESFLLQIVLSFLFDIYDSKSLQVSNIITFYYVINLDSHLIWCRLFIGLKFESSLFKERVKYDLSIMKIFSDAFRYQLQ